MDPGSAFRPSGMTTAIVAESGRYFRREIGWYSRRVAPV
jgi:hypothetical protein